MSMEQNPIAKWPFGAATIIMLAVAAGATDIEIINNMTIVDGEDVISTGDRTLNLLIANDREEQDHRSGKPHTREWHEWYHHLRC